MKIIFNPLSGKFDFINDGVITGSGTSGQVAFWDSSTNITGESNLYWDSTNNRLGVGTASPQQPLHINGIGRFDGSLFVGATLSTGDAAIKLGQGRTGIGYAFVDLVGDTTYTDYALRFIRNNTGANASSEILHRGTGDLNIATIDVANLKFTTSSVERLRITSGGNVGINQSNPGHTLDVNGSINASTFYNNVNTAFNVLRNNLGNPTVEEKALFHGQFNNKFRFISPTLQEESTDGVTWTTSTRATANQLGDMMIGEGQVTQFDAIPTGTLNTYGGYRLTWDVVGTTGYVFLDQLYIFNSTNGNNVTLKIEAFHNTNGWTTLSTQTSNNWPGHWSVKHTSIPYSNSASQYSRMRLTFETNRTGFTNAFTLYAIEWFGGYPSGRRNVESYDRSRNVFFPGTVQGSRLISTIATGTAPLSVISTTVSTNLNADMVDGYHSSSLWRSDGGVWNPTANITLGQTANNQEWSFDITRNGFTGGYWHVWDSANLTMLKVDAVTGKVSAPYNFVGNLEGSAATLTTSRTISLTGDVSYTSDPFNGSANVTGTATLASVGTAGTYTKVTTDAKGRVTSGTTLSATDIPALDAAKITTGTIDAARLPSYVDDVIEGANLAAFPVTGETGKIYVALDTNKTYRWSGSAYVYITSGAVDSVAGKTGVVTLVKADVGLSNVDNTADSTKSVLSSATLTTARTLTIGSTGKTFNGSADVSWTLAEIGAQVAGSYAAASHTHAVATTSADGFMSSLDKTKLDGIESGAQVNTVNSVAGKTGIVTLVKGDVGLANVDNTADSTKSVSSAATLTTARTLTIGSTGKTFNGSANVSWSLAEIGAADATATVNLTGNQTISGIKSFSGSISLTASGPTDALNMNNNSIVGINNLVIGDPGPNEGIEWLGGNLWKIWESPNDLTTNTGGNLQIVQGTTRRATFNTSGQLELPITTGTAPLLITSTTRVANLNVATAGTADTWTTARTITIGSTGKSINGSADVSWTLTEIGAYAATNPAGYTSNTGTVTSVTGTGGYGGLTLSGTVTSSGNITLSGTPTGTWPISVSGNSATSTVANNLVYEDNRIISPSELTATRLRFGFTSWANNNTAPYADFLHLRSYTDASGGNDNLVMFRKDAIGMRIYQQTFDSINAYSTFKDVAFTDSSITGNAATATTLATARSINGTSFNGSADITTANWGTGRTITIGSTGKSVNGSANVSWSLAEIGAQATLTNPVTGTGTTNYVTKWTSGSAIGNSQIFDNGTNVGIGTATPGASLHVAGAISSAPTGDGFLAGIQSGYAVIHLNGSAATGSLIDFSVSGTDTKGRILYDNTNNYFVFNTNGSERVRITSTGDMGIGITAPTEKLEVFGSIRLSDGNADGPQLKLGSSGFSDWNIDNFSGSLRAYYASTEYLRLTSAGNLGIGTSSPSAKLHVIGNATISSTLSTVNAKITGTLTDYLNLAGTAGQVLSSTGTGIEWITLSGGGGGASTIAVKDETVSIGSSFTTLDFQGNNIQATASSSTAVVTVFNNAGTGSMYVDAVTTNYAPGTTFADIEIDTSNVFVSSPDAASSTSKLIATVTFGVENVSNFDEFNSFEFRLYNFSQSLVVSNTTHTWTGYMSKNEGATTTVFTFHIPLDTDVAPGDEIRVQAKQVVSITPEIYYCAITLMEGTT